MILHLADLPPCWSEPAESELEFPAPEPVPEKRSSPTMLGVVIAAGLGWYLSRRAPEEVRP